MMQQPHCSSVGAAARSQHVPPPRACTCSRAVSCCSHTSSRNGDSRAQQRQQQQQQQLQARLCDWRSRISRATAAAAAAATAADAAGGAPAAPGAAARSAAAGTQPSAPAPAVAAAAESLSVGQEVEVSCARHGTGGVGVCLFGPSRLVLLVRGALPGELLVTRITAVKKSHAEGIKLASLAPHHNAVAPACRHFGPCGGCSLQSLAYDAQLAAKMDHVAGLLTRVGKLGADAVEAARAAPLGAAQTYGYRNKVQLAFSSRVWVQAGEQQGVQQLDGQQKQQQLDAQQQQGQQQGVEGVAQGREQPGWGLGYLLPGSSDVVLPIQECCLAPPEVNHVITRVRQLCQQQGLEPHNSPGGGGILRHLIVRTAAAAAAAGAEPDAAAAVATGAAVAATGAAAAAAAAAAPALSLMVVLVTSPATTARERQQVQALERVAAALMASCPGLVTVVHSTEAAAAAAAAAPAPGGKRGGGGGGSSGARGPRGRTSSSSTRRKRGGSDGSDGGDASDGGGGSGRGSSRRGAQALRVASSRVLVGPGCLVESLCGLNFRVSPHSFFQTNSQQAALLYQEVVRAVAGCRSLVGGTDAAAAAAVDTAAGVVHAPEAATAAAGVVLDLYCGTGTIGMLLAAGLPEHHVVGCDVLPSSIADAQANALLNNVTNVTFVCGDLNRMLLPRGGQRAEQLQKQDRQQRQPAQSPHSVGEAGGGSQHSPVQLQQLRPRVVVVDPARAGLGQGVVEHLLSSGADRIVYVSCNAATQARDLGLLCGTAAAAAGGAGGTSGAAGAGVYSLTSWTGVDLFPHTHVDHLETVVVLDRCNLS